MSYLDKMSDALVLAANDRTSTRPEVAALDRDITRRLAWQLWRVFQEETIRVPLFWGLKWTIRVADLRPLWVVMFGDEPAPTDTLVFPPAA